MKQKLLLKKHLHERADEYAYQETKKRFKQKLR